MANGIKIGNLDISAFKVGSADTKVYLGDTLLYPQSPTPIIPTAYTQVSYVESTGNTGLNLGTTANQNTRIVAVMQTTNSSNNGRLLGCGGYNLSPNGWQFDYEPSIGGTLHISWGTLNRWTTYNDCVGDTDVHTYDWDKNYFYRDKGTVNEFSATTTFGNFQTTDPIALFCNYLQSWGGMENYWNGRCYSCKLYDDGTLIRDLIPCYRNSDNKAGMYDLVNDVFYYPPSGNLVIPTTSITYSVTLTGLENGDTIDYINWNNGDSYEFAPGNGTYTYTTTATSIDVNITYDSSSYSANADYAVLDENDTSYTFVLTPTGGGGLTQIPYGADMTQYYNQSFSRFVINDTSLPSGYSQISLGFNTGGNGNIASWATNFTVGSTNVSSLPCDVTDTDIITSWTTYDSGWQTTNLNPFQDLRIEFI